MDLLAKLALAFKGDAGVGRPPLSRGFASIFGYRFGDEGTPAYAEAVREAYERNAVAQRAVRLVTEGVGGAPLTCSDPAVRALVTATSAGQSLLETVAAHIVLHGNAYVQILGGPDDRPAELYALRPDRVTIQCDARGWPALFAYTAGEVVERIPVDDGLGRANIIHIRAFHPTDDHYGLGCLGAAVAAVRTHNAAVRWNRALLDNAARPSGALVYDPPDGPATLSADQFRRLKDELEASYAGNHNAGRPMVLEGGLKWQSIAMTPAEMDFAKLKDGAAREIALAFGVPPNLLGLPGDNTYANYKEANKALWRLTLLPLAAKILDAIVEGLAPWYPGVRLAVDVDKVTALAEDRQMLWAQVNAASFLSPEEKRAMLGIA